MTSDEQKFIDAAIANDCATHRYNLAARTALAGYTLDPDERVAAIQARKDAAKAANDASIELHKAQKRVTDPFVFPK